MRLKMEPINIEMVKKYFIWVVLSHRQESRELLLYGIQGKVVYDLEL